MSTVNKTLADEARSIFDDLGYDVAGDGAEFRAVRDWKEVRVTLEEPPTDAPDSLGCVVTRAEDSEGVIRELSRTDPACEWAVIGVREDGSYEVARTP
jgi:hypothetical protein